MWFIVNPSAELSPFDDPVEGLLRVGVTLTVSTEQFENNILSIWSFGTL